MTANKLATNRRRCILSQCTRAPLQRATDAGAPGGSILPHRAASAEAPARGEATGEARGQATGERPREPAAFRAVQRPEREDGERRPAQGHLEEAGWGCQAFGEHAYGVGGKDD